MREAARLATASDVELLGALAATAVAEQAGDRGGAVWAAREAPAIPATALLAAAIDDPTQLVLAGTIDDAVVGYAAVRTETLRDGRVLGVLTDIYVEPEGREIGIGELLVEEVLAWCRVQGCAGVDAMVLPGNRSTKNFFETAGFTARAIVVHRSLR